MLQLHLSDQQLNCLLYLNTVHYSASVCFMSYFARIQSMRVEVCYKHLIFHLQVGFVCRITNTCPGVYRGLFVNKITLKRYKDILQIQIKHNKMHSHSTLPTRSFIHSFTRSLINKFIHSFIPITHHTTHASPMHHPFITHCIILCITHSSQRIIPCITHSSHCISTHHTSKT